MLIFTKSRLAMKSLPQKRDEKQTSENNKECMLFSRHSGWCYTTFWMMLHDILDDDYIQWHPTLIGHYTDFWPLLIWTLLPNLTFYLIVQGFHRTYATGAACQQRTLTPPDTWSCPTLGLACVLMSRPISPELVLSPDFWISNIPRYFSFA